MAKMERAGQAARIAVATSRIVGRNAGRNRYLRAGWSAAQVTFQSYGRILRLLLLEVTGLFFSFFALIGSFALIREYRAWFAGKLGPERFILAAVFTAMFIWFAVSSFRKAKSKPGAARR